MYLLVFNVFHIIDELTTSAHQVVNPSSQTPTRSSSSLHQLQLLAVEFLSRDDPNFLYALDS